MSIMLTMKNRRMKKILSMMKVQPRKTKQNNTEPFNDVGKIDGEDPAKGERIQNEDNSKIDEENVEEIKDDKQTDDDNESKNDHENDKNELFGLKPVFLGNKTQGICT